MRRSQTVVDVGLIPGLLMAGVNANSIPFVLTAMNFPIGEFINDNEFPFGYSPKTYSRIRKELMALRDRDSNELCIIGTQRVYECINGRSRSTTVKCPYTGMVSGHSYDLVNLYKYAIKLYNDSIAKPESIRVPIMAKIPNMEDDSDMQFTFMVDFPGVNNLLVEKLWSKYVYGVFGTVGNTNRNMISSMWQECRGIVDSNRVSFNKGDIITSRNYRSR